MSDLFRIQRQLRRFDFDRGLPLVEAEEEGTRLVLEVPVEVEKRPGGGLQLAHVLTPFGQPARRLFSRFVFDQDGNLLPDECRFNRTT